MSQYIHSLMTDKRGGPIEAVIKFFLWLMSLVYGRCVQFMQGLYEQKKLPVYRAPYPVISIGNITVGGSGKTPLTIWVVQQLIANGLRPVVLSRGYMNESGAESDEAAMIAQETKVPVLTGSNRIANIKKAAKTIPVDVFICDDAFQHWKLSRLINIVTIDANNPFGNGQLLPRGILREPKESLQRADVIVLTKIQGRGYSILMNQLRTLNRRASIIESTYEVKGLVPIEGGESLNVDVLKGQRIVCISALADPQSFEDSLRAQGAIIERSFTFIDHHLYTPKDVKAIVDFCKAKGITTCITTQKDAVKLNALRNSFGNIDVLYLKIEVKMINGYEEFLKNILACCPR